MTRIGLLSDTHGYLDPTLKEHFAECDEIWHAGDIGTLDVLHQLSAWKPVRAVSGNIDPREICLEATEVLQWHCEEVTVLMLHIGGFPGRYNAHARALIREHQPGLVICGHSHILKILYDKELRHLHVNPGASGRQGLHHVRTAVRFTINGADIRDMQVIELGKRGVL